MKLGDWFWIGTVILIAVLFTRLWHVYNYFCTK